MRVGESSQYSILTWSVVCELLVLLHGFCLSTPRQDAMRYGHAAKETKSKA